MFDRLSKFWNRRPYWNALWALLIFSVVGAAVDEISKISKRPACPNGLAPICLTQEGRSRTLCVRKWQMYDDENCALLWMTPPAYGTWKADSRVCGSFILQKGVCP